MEDILDTEIVIRLGNINYLLDGLEKLSKLLKKADIQDKELKDEVEVYMLAIFIGIIRMLPRTLRSGMAERFEELTGLKIKDLM